MFGATFALMTPVSAGANQLGYYQVPNSWCGTGCHLKGVRASLTAPASWTIVSNQAGVETVGMTGNSSSTNWAEVGFDMTKSVTFPYDCDNRPSTAPNIDNFYETVDTGGIKSCTITQNVVNSESHDFRVQRWMDSECGLSDCVGDWIDGVRKAIVDFANTEGSSVYVEGEIVRSGGYDSSTVIQASYPGAGTYIWQRTSDTYTTSGGAGSFTAIGAAECNDAGLFFLGSISGGFNINFDLADPACTG